jgi:dephospho-CoA kinase
MKRVIAITGMTGSGKSEVVKYLEQNNFFKIYFGQATLDEIKKRGWLLTPENEKKAREAIRKDYGMAAYAILNLEKITKALINLSVVIDGLYSWSEYKVLKEKFKDDLLVIAVTAPRQLRYQRLAARPVRPLTAAEAENRDIVEIENIEKAGPIAMADYTIVNDGALAELNQKIDSVLKEIGYKFN